jgi:hypothetical protein
MADEELKPWLPNTQTSALRHGDDTDDSEHQAETAVWATGERPQPPITAPHRLAQAVRAETEGGDTRVADEELES